MSGAIVIKFGGEVVESESQLENLAFSIKKLHSKGEKIVLVHGGGPYATALSKKLGIESVMIGGRRVTDKDTLEVMKMTLPGVLNSNILAILKKHNLPGTTVSAISCVDAHMRPPKAVSGSDGKVVDFGFVGDIDDVDPTIINYLIQGNYIPVISPLCADSNGAILNINADTVAVQLAIGLKAKKLVMITAVGGVFKDIKDPASKFNALTVSKAKELIKDGTIQGGMIPKLEEGFKVIESGLDSYHIVNTETPDRIEREINRPGSEGTAIVRG